MVAKSRGKNDLARETDFRANIVLAAVPLEYDEGVARCGRRPMRISGHHHGERCLQSMRSISTLRKAPAQLLREVHVSIPCERTELSELEFIMRRLPSVIAQRARGFNHDVELSGAVCEQCGTFQEVATLRAHHRLCGAAQYFGCFSRPPKLQCLIGAPFVCLACTLKVTGDRPVRGAIPAER